MYVWLRGLNALLLCQLVQSSGFYSRPDIKAPKVTVHVNNIEANENDLLFLTPYFSHQDGRFIYNLRGELIWAGHENSRSGVLLRAQNLRPILYQGSTHLAYTSVQEVYALKDCTNMIMNSNYSIVVQLNNSTGSMHLDPHDFEIINNGSRIIQAASIAHDRLQNSEQNEMLELGPTVIKEALFQVVDIETRRVDFEWRSLDHVPINQSCISVEHPDYFHINSVEADSQHNYIINGYNVCTIYKINGTDSSIIWRLGGPKSDFEILNNYQLKHVHHVRMQDLATINLPPDLRSSVSNTTHLALSIFDNAFDTAGPPTATSSSAIILLLDVVAMTAQVIERYIQPHGKFAAMFGSIQLLDNGDRFIGWGSTREISQHTQSGELVYHAELGDETSMIGSLRIFRGKWVATPPMDPDLYTFSWICGWETVMYVSWNGATEVRGWRFWGGSSLVGPWEEVALVGKEGFETRVRARFFAMYAFVEALDAGGVVLGRSKVVRSLVPRPIFSRGCSEFCCPETLVWDDDADACERLGMGMSALDVDQRIVKQNDEL